MITESRQRLDVCILLTSIELFQELNHERDIIDS